MRQDDRDGHGPGTERRPFALFVSTTGCAGDLRRHLGSADYSYGFVLRALAPVLERLGTWQVVDRPESRLSHLAAQARAEGLRPVHLVLHPAHNANFVPDVPTVLFPFWEFPRIPDRDFGYDTRQNWARMCRGADRIVTACRFTAGAIEHAGVEVPIDVIPVPLPPTAFEIPDWEPSATWSAECRHLVLGGEPGEHTAIPDANASPNGHRPAVWKRAIRGGYRRYVRPWLDPRSIERVKRLRRMLLQIPDQPTPLLPSSRLDLSGLVFLSLFNPSDRRKNALDILTAFLLAFRERADATLVLKLATSASREFHDLAEFLAEYRKLGLEHRCRVVLLTDYLTDDQLAGLFGATTFYVNASRAEGACLPLQQAMAAGRPVIAPAHTAMADYVDDSAALVVRAYPEPTFWPHDPEKRHETFWNRLVWSDLRDRMLEAAEMVESDRVRYDLLASEARRRMFGYASVDQVASLWREALDRLPCESVRLAATG